MFNHHPYHYHLRHHHYHYHHNHYHSMYLTRVAYSVKRARARHQRF